MLALETSRTRSRKIQAQREDLRRVPGWGRAIDDGLTVGREAGIEDRLLAEGELREGVAQGSGRRSLSASQQVGSRDHEGDGDDRGGKSPAASARRRRSGDDASWRGDARERLQIEGQVVCGMEPLLGVLLQAVADDP